MKKIILIPDSFKGTLSSTDACDVMHRAISAHFPHAEILSVPVADGGEGSVEAFLTAVGGRRVSTLVKGPYLEEMESFYGILSDSTTAVIEMAACAGLPLVAGRENPLVTSTYGVGELMLHAVSSGCKRIVLGLGGSCTNDGGAGAAVAAGVRFFNSEDKEFLPTGGTLSEIARVDVSGLDSRLKEAEITVMCDIDNPLFGPAGAACVFGPQKGADEAQVKLLDEGLRQLDWAVRRSLNRTLSENPGSGAAGGMGFGMQAFFNAPLEMGIEAVLDTVGFDHMLEGADLVFSGEGSMDFQSVRGKVLAGVAKRTKKANVPLIGLAGRLGEGFEELYPLGLTAAFSINRAAQPFSEAAPHTAENLFLMMDNLCRLLKLGQK